MKRSRFMEEQSIGILQVAEAGAKTAELARLHGKRATAPFLRRSKART
jgi:putative transposase